MKQINLEFQHGRLVLSVGDKAYFISHYDLMDLLDRNLVQGKFHELNPANLYANLETFDSVVYLEILKQRDYSLDEIAEHFQVSKAKLETWLETRSDVIEQIKNRDPGSFAAAVQSYGERIKKRLKKE